VFELTRNERFCPSHEDYNQWKCKQKLEHSKIDIMSSFHCILYHELISNPIVHMS